VSLVIRDLAVAFGGVAALGGVSFSVVPGSITSLIGPNGAGKTTAFNAITGYLPRHEGEITFGERRLTGLRPCDIAACGIVRTFQKTSVFPALTVFENVMIGLHLRGRASFWQVLLRRRRVMAEDRALAEEAEEILGFVGLARQRAAIASTLPYGEQRLLELAIAMAARPRVLLLDEPAAGMTGSEKVAATQLIQRIRARQITVLLVEHDMRLVMGISDHVVVLNGGRLIAEGPPAAIVAHPEVITAYLGSTPRRMGSLEGPPMPPSARGAPA
jgi:branched-chain amino acid transport system ATP-binding protein